MGYQVTDNEQSGEHSNQTAYVGNDIFGPLLKQLANQYGTQQASADLIFGGKQYGKARTYLPDQYRDLTASQGQSLNNARAVQQQNQKMPTYKGPDGTVWAWDNDAQIYVGWQKGEGQSKYTEKVGAWSPWDQENSTPPWKRGGTSGGDSGSGTGTSVGGGGSTTTPPSGGGGGSTTPPTPPGGSGGSGGGSAGNGGIGGETGGGRGGSVGGGLNPTPSTVPQPEGSRGTMRRVPGVGRADETGLTGLGIRTESPATIAGQTGKTGIRSESETQEFGRRFGETPTGLSASYNPRSDNPFDAGDPNDRGNWDTNYDPRPSSRTLGKDEQTSDLASQHPATFRHAMDRIGENPDYYKNAGAFREPLAQGTASEGGDWLNMKRKPEESAAQDTFAQLLAGLRGR